MGTQAPPSIYIGAGGHASWAEKTLTSAFVALLVETPERQSPQQGQGWLWALPAPPHPGRHSHPSPDEVFAHRTESGLPEERGNELVVLDVVDFGLFDGSTAVHSWELGLVFTTHGLFAIWGPWGREVSPSPGKDNIPGVPPRVALGRPLIGTASLSFNPSSSLSTYVPSPGQEGLTYIFQEILHRHQHLGLGL